MTEGIQQHEALATDCVVDHLILGASGSVTAAHLPSYLVALRSFYANRVTVVLSDGASQFVPVGVLRLYAHEVLVDGDAVDGTPHVRLSDQADAMVVLPATGNTVGQIAHGLAPNLLTSTALAFGRPITLFPAMNERMWSRPAVLRNIAQLRADGHVVVDPVVRNVFVTSAQAVRPSLALPEPPDVVKFLRGLHEKSELSGDHQQSSRESLHDGV